MPVPETAVNLDGDLPFRQNDVGASRQAPVMEPEPETHGMQCLAQPDLGPRMLAVYPGHHPGPGLLVHDIGQGAATSLLGECYDSIRMHH